MLTDFLIENREQILELTKTRTLERTLGKVISPKLAEGLPLFYSSLVETFQNAGAPGEAHVTGEHGKELYRLGYTVTEVVNSYGALCQAVTETAETLKTKIEAREFNVLNGTLDRAIAEAVTDFELAQKQNTNLEDSERLGSLVNELRTCLETALLAHSSMKKGLVGIAGSTNALMERNLFRMGELLDGTLTEVRLRSEAKAVLRRFRLIDAVSEVEITATANGRGRDVALSIHVDPKLEVLADRNLVVSALSNVVGNAVKFTKTGGVVVIRSLEQAQTVALEVEDQCGGLPQGKIEELFKPFTQKNADRSGAGLGLAIANKALAANDGSLHAADVPGKGCIFTLTLPRAPKSLTPLRSPALH